MKIVHLDSNIQLDTAASIATQLGGNGVEAEGRDRTRREGAGALIRMEAD